MQVRECCLACRWIHALQRHCAYLPQPWRHDFCVFVPIKLWSLVPDPMPRRQSTDFSFLVSDLLQAATRGHMPPQQTASPTTTSSEYNLCRGAGEVPPCLGILFLAAELGGGVLVAKDASCWLATMAVAQSGLLGLITLPQIGRLQCLVLID